MMGFGTACPHSIVVGLFAASPHHAYGVAPGFPLQSGLIMIGIAAIRISKDKVNYIRCFAFEQLIMYKF